MPHLATIQTSLWCMGDVTWTLGLHCSYFAGNKPVIVYG